MDATAFIIGNGESRLQYPIEKLKYQGTVYGCNAIYRDYPHLCDNIMAVDPPMHSELLHAKKTRRLTFKLLSDKDVEDWNYTFPGESLKKDKPRELTYWHSYKRGKKHVEHKYKDFRKTKGSGCSAVFHAALQGYTKIIMVGFDIIGNVQREGEEISNRLYNNVYKNTMHYPVRASQKTYLQFEWLFQLTQTFKRFPEIDFFLFTSKNYLDHNNKYKLYFDTAPRNIRCGDYSQLDQMLNGDADYINWIYY